MGPSSASRFSLLKLRACTVRYSLPYTVHTWLRVSRRKRRPTSNHVCHCSMVLAQPTRRYATQNSITQAVVRGPTWWLSFWLRYPDVEYVAASLVRSKSARTSEPVTASKKLRPIELRSARGGHKNVPREGPRFSSSETRDGEYPHTFQSL